MKVKLRKKGGRNLAKLRETQKNVSSSIDPNVVGTNPQKVKQDIQKDVARGEGAMTSREAGAMND